MKSKKIRVHEFAKDIDISSEELLKLLEKAGFDITSHMAVLSQEALDFLNEEHKKTPDKHAGKKEQIKTMTPNQKTKSKKMSSPTGRFRSHVKKTSTFKQEPIQRSPEALAEEAREKVLQEGLVIEAMTPAQFSLLIGEPTPGVILTLLKWGIACPKNQLLQEEMIARLAGHYNIPAAKKSLEKTEKSTTAGIIEETPHVVLAEEKMAARPPVIVVMGHVDHGKTTLLDFIRNTRVAAKEKGGITQHLGAYEVKTSHGNIVFLDTPGHEAFSKIRVRGAKVADIVILVVAADDSIMPQTEEAINHAKAMKVPVVVAINKIDKVEQHQIETVKRDLAQRDLLPEEWGGNIVCVPISAKLGQGVDQLLEMVALQAEMLELKADKSIPARGYILESKLEKGRGPVATLICQHGTIKIGDYFSCGKTVGKVNSLVNSYGEYISSAGPAIPVLVAGFSALPEAGDFLSVVSQKEYKKARTTNIEQKVVTAPKVTSTQDFNLIVKADSKSSVEALLGALAKLSKKIEKGFNILHSAVGNVNESDILLASATGAMIIGLHVKAEANTQIFARKHAVEIRLFDIIYKLVEDLEEFSESKKEIKKIKTKIGEAVVLRVFDIKNIGVIAGCVIKDGRCTRDSSLVVWRGKTKIGEGKIKSLQREKKTVKEVHTGFECGFLIDGFTDWQVDDRVECFLDMLPNSKK